MLLEVYIENFALIDKLRLNFETGFNVLSGETGSGKSIFIDALNLCLGERYDKNFIRKGTTKGLVEAVFYTQNIEVISMINDYGIGIKKEDNIIISRDIFSDGKSITKINGRNVRLSFLKEISPMLIDIHSQHESSMLLKKENHIRFLDLYGQDKLNELKKEYEIHYREYIALKKQLNNINENKDDMQIQREIDLIKFQIEEIESVSLDENEYERLIKERDIFRNSQKIYSNLNEAYFNLYENNINAYDFISKSIKSLKDIYSFDEKLDSFYKQLEDISYKIQDIANDMRDYKENIDFSPQSLNEIETKVDAINNLKRKYGSSIKDIISYKEKIKINLDEILGRDEKINLLKEKIESIRVKLKLKSDDITIQRKKVANEMQKSICEELLSLNMQNVSFEVDFRDSEDFMSGGKDIVEFMVSFNLGEDLKPINKVASGGEMSRFMLGFKSILSDIDDIQTLVFDEIDTGISGITAQIVGQKIKNISQKKQIICITHLPQIAANSDVHFYIEKVTTDDRTYTKIDKLSENGKIREIARLIGGMNITQKTIEHAKEIIKFAKK